MRSLLVATVVADVEIDRVGIFFGRIIDSVSYDGLPGQLDAIAVAYGYCSPACNPWFTLKVRAPDGREVPFTSDTEVPVQLRPLLGSDLHTFLGTWPLSLTFEQQGVYFVDIQMAGEPARSHPIGVKDQLGRRSDGRFTKVSGR